MSRYTSKHTGSEIDTAVDIANGYGLGKDATVYISDANTATKAGWYYWGKGAVNTPSNYGAILVISRYSNITTQLAFLDEGGVTASKICVRKQMDGVWGEWEWVNPPMALGVEYRTTERYLEKPVYALCANFGANIDGSSMYFGENVLRIVRGQAYSGQGDGLYPWYQGKTINNWTAFFDFTVGTDTSDNIRKIKVTCRANSSASNTYSTTYVVLYYTKSTD